MRYRLRTTATLAAFGIAVGAAGAALEQEAARELKKTLVATTAHFAFHSDFEVNLHDALLEAGRTRWSDKPELFHSGPESECFAELPRVVRSA